MNPPEPRLALKCWALHACAQLLLVLAVCAQKSGTIRVRLARPSGTAAARSSEEGPLRLLLFDSAVTFGRFSDPVRVASFAPDGRESYVLDGVPPGEYALVAHRDEDADGELDKNFIGIPTEPIAISRGYRPKGPPVYARASFTLSPGEERVIEVELDRVLGPRGLFGVGVGVLGRSSPYRGSDTGVFQPIPAITFTGERLQWFGPSLRYGIAGSDRLRLAATARYRLRAYDERDSPFLAGLGDRRSTLLAGPALIAELPAGVNLLAGYEHDVLDQIGGGRFRIEATRSFEWRSARFTPKLAVNWTAAELANHDFGVPADRATAQRPAYDVDAILTLEAGVQSFVELSRNWRIVFDVAVEFLSDEVVASPIVDDERVIQGFVALTYGF